MANEPLSGEADLTCTVLEFFLSVSSRKGFRDTGLSGAVLGIWLNAVAMGEGKLLEGDVARLRKGLFEGKFAVSPGDICLSVSGGRYTLAGRRRAVEAGERFKRPMSLCV